MTSEFSITRLANGAVTRTPFAHYEVDVANNIVTRYYYFGGQLIAMRQGSAQPTYLHTDALGSVVAASPVGGTTSALQRYCGYGRLRSAGSGGAWNCGTAANLFDTDRTYTGQQADGPGLLYYHARYYDPAAGQFISPDSLVPDPTNVMDYQRYAYARGNPLRYSDPSGHIPEKEACRYLGACTEEEFVDKYGQELTDLLWGTDVNWGDKLEWGENVGMLVLLEDGRGGHSGVLWGIEGEGKGKPIWLDLLGKSGKRGFDTTKRIPEVDDVYHLPLADEFNNVGYYRTKYLDLGELWWASVPVAGTALASKAIGMSVIPPIVAKTATASMLGGIATQAYDLVGSLGDTVTGAPVVGPLAKEIKYYWPRVMSPWVDYPVLRLSSVGSLPFTLHLKGPGGN